MKSSTKSLGVKVSLAVLAVVSVLGLVQAETGRSEKANKYIGAEKCKSCHQAEASGNQFGVWEKAPHAKAFETLASDAAKAIAKEKGIEDPQKSDQCLRCHVTAFGVPAEAIKKGFDNKGVQCEACHGPGDLHVKARFAAAAEASDKEASTYQTIPADEIVAKVDESTCVKCHNEESPTFKPFCFWHRSAAIRHLDPRKPHPELTDCGCPTCSCKTGGEGHECGVSKSSK
jgi:hypothetical protein